VRTHDNQAHPVIARKTIQFFSQNSSENRRLAINSSQATRIPQERHLVVQVSFRCNNSCCNGIGTCECKCNRCHHMNNIKSGPIATRNGNAMFKGGKAGLAQVGRHKNGFRRTLQRGRQYSVRSPTIPLGAEGRIHRVFIPVLGKTQCELPKLWSCRPERRLLGTMAKHFRSVQH
jgi:hypothetical protein